MIPPSHPALISYPQPAWFGRILPKNKIYEHSGANKQLKDLFVQQVEQIVWQYKLAPETINLPARPDVPEIQIFSIQLKTPDLHQDVLRCLDGAVRYPIIYELGHAGSTRVIAACKRPAQSAASHWLLSGYFATDWLPAATPRTPLPLALDLGSLYEQLLNHLLPLPARPLESLADRVLRVEQVAVKQREVASTARRLAREKQFNRKVAINATLRQLQQELEQLSR